MKKLLYTLLMTCNVPLLPSSSSSSSEDKSYLKLLDASEKLRTLVLSTEPDNYHRQRFEKLLWAVAYVKAGKEIDSAFMNRFDDFWQPWDCYVAQYCVMQLAETHKLCPQAALECIRAAKEIALPLDKAFERYTTIEQLKKPLKKSPS